MPHLAAPDLWSKNDSAPIIKIICDDDGGSVLEKNASACGRLLLFRYFVVEARIVRRAQGKSNLRRIKVAGTKRGDRGA